MVFKIVFYKNPEGVWKHFNLTEHDQMIEKKDQKSVLVKVKPFQSTWFWVLC